jgi:hypothetical protein
MKKHGFLLVFLAMLSAGLYAEPSFAVGAGGEMNGYSRGGIGIGIGGGLDYRFSEMFSAGVRGLYGLDLSDSVNKISVIEVTGNVRWYFLRFSGLLNYYYLWQSRFHVFAQFDIGGAFVYTEDTDSKAESGISLGATAGARIVFGNFYTEPYLRASLTGLYGLGVMFGWIFRPYGE